jgi:hypothetical protein
MSCSPPLVFNSFLGRFFLFYLFEFYNLLGVSKVPHPVSLSLLARSGTVWDKQSTRSRQCRISYQNKQNLCRIKGLYQYVLCQFAHSYSTSVSCYGSQVDSNSAAPCCRYIPTGYFSSSLSLCVSQVHTSYIITSESCLSMFL